LASTSGWPSVETGGRSRQAAHGRAATSAAFAAGRSPGRRYDDGRAAGAGSTRGLQSARGAASMPANSNRVVVVGAGAVGLTAALALGRRGIPTVLLAAESELVMELRGSTFHPPTLDLLDEFDVVPRMIEVGLKAPTWQFRDRETGPVATFDLSLLAPDTNHPYRVQCEQWKLMRLLEEMLRRLPRPH